jgi:FkbM family methyltransferase
MKSRYAGCPSYEAARETYQFIWNRAEHEKRTRRRQFYKQMLRPSDLVFDVGANVGNYAKTFLSLGAAVVAIEPDPRNIVVLRRRLGKRAWIEQCALGPSEGTAELNLANYGGISTLSAESVKTTPTNWVGRVTVPLSTIDILAAKYGRPRYIKIDVELYDYEVLCGMSQNAPIISFEYQLKRLEVAEKCIARLSEAKFNFVSEGDYEFALPKAVNGMDLVPILRSYQQRKSYGDVFALFDQV